MPNPIEEKDDPKQLAFFCTGKGLIILTAAEIKELTVKQHEEG